MLVLAGYDGMSSSGVWSAIKAIVTEEWPMTTPPDQLLFPMVLLWLALAAVGVFTQCLAFKLSGCLGSLARGGYEALGGATPARAVKWVRTCFGS